MLIRLIPILLALFLFSSCAPHVFGVPEEQWARMTTEQRNVAMEAYYRQQKINAERRLAESRRAAEEAKMARIRAERDAELEPHHPQVTPLPSSWRYGDLIRVTVDGGEMNFDGRYREYQPLSFTIFRGQRKALVFRRTGRKAHLALTVWVEYRNNTFYFDIGKRGRHREHAKQINYRGRWKTGKKFKHLSLDSHTASKARNISIAIKMLSPSRY